jgi:hypothetical protein
MVLSWTLVEALAATEVYFHAVEAVRPCVLDFRFPETSLGTCTN